MDQDQEIAKIWARVTDLEKNVTTLQSQMDKLDEMILSNPGYQKKEEK